MGLINNIRNFFSNSNSKKNAQLPVNNEYEKSRLAGKIVDLRDKIKRINSFDSCLWNLSNISSYDLIRMKSLDELQQLASSLENRLSELNRQSQKSNSRQEALEASKWTGQKPKHMSVLDFDRFQRSDDGR